MCIGNKIFHSLTVVEHYVAESINDGNGIPPMVGYFVKPQGVGIYSNSFNVFWFTSAD